MAIPPNIPTSFVPHSTSATQRRFHADFTSTLSFLAYIILCVVFALALSVFLYGRILSASQSAKESKLAQAESAINSVTVESFLRLRDRLASGEALLNGHTAFSGFFTSFGTLLPTTVRFTSLHLSLDGNGTVKFEGSGVAKNFNALAATSMAFAKDGRVKDAIFSNIVVNTKDSSVSFALVATLDSKLVAFSP